MHSIRYGTAGSSRGGDPGGEPDGFANAVNDQRTCEPLIRFKALKVVRDQAGHTRVYPDINLPAAICGLSGLSPFLKGEALQYVHEDGSLLFKRLVNPGQDISLCLDEDETFFLPVATGQLLGRGGARADYVPEFLHTREMRRGQPVSDPVSVISPPEYLKYMPGRERRVRSLRRQASRLQQAQQTGHNTYTGSAQDQVVQQLLRNRAAVLGAERQTALLGQRMTIGGEKWARKRQRR